MAGQATAKFRAKVEQVMGEFKAGRLASNGRVVKDRKQAEAIALSEARAHVQMGRKQRRKPHQEE